MSAVCALGAGRGGSRDASSFRPGACPVPPDLEVGTPRPGEGHDASPASGAGLGAAQVPQPPGSRTPRSALRRPWGRAAGPGFLTGRSRAQPATEPSGAAGAEQKSEDSSRGPSFDECVWGKRQRGADDVACETPKELAGPDPGALAVNSPSACNDLAAGSRPVVRPCFDVRLVTLIGSSASCALRPGQLSEHREVSLALLRLVT